MVKFPTIWSSNSAKNSDAVAYSDVNTSYSSAFISYSSSTVGSDEFNKLPEAWTPVTKQPAMWQANAAAIVNQYAYDSASNTYDSSSQSYDGIVAGEEMTNTNKPTMWSAA